MHNCEVLQEEIFDLALGEADGASKARILAELDVCAHCRAEYDAIRQTADLYTTARVLDVPTESYWQKFEADLQADIALYTAPPARFQEEKSNIETALPSFAERLQRLFSSTIAVPAPALLLILAAVPLTAFFALRGNSAEKTNVLPSAPTVKEENAAISPQISDVAPNIAPTPQIIEKIIEKTVWRDRVVTEKVYVNIPAASSKQARVKSSAPKNNGDAPANEMPSVNLAEFEPLNNMDVKVWDKQSADARK